MEEGHVIFFAPIPSEIERADFSEDWWPKLKGFPLNIVYMHSDTIGVAYALYSPDLRTFQENQTERELTYNNKLGGTYRVCVVLRKNGRIETRKYRGDNVISVVCANDFNTAMPHTTMIGIQEDEPTEQLLRRY